MSAAQPVAVITGGSRGIGLAAARRFSQDGYTAVSASRTPPPVGARVEHVPTDVADEGSVAALVEHVVRRHGGIDILVNNAGIEVEGTVEQTTLAQWQSVFAVNVTGTFLCTRAAMPALRERAGAIVNVSSVDGHWAEPGLAAYCASKGAVLAFTKSIALDHGPEGVRCNAVCPGYAATEMLEQFFDAQPDPHGARAGAVAMHPLRRIAAPQEVAEAIVWLASPAARFITGQILSVDGGLTAGRTS